MMTVHEVCDLAGISVRTLQYYDKIGLLHPAKVTEAGYRLYDEAALEKLQHILLFRELEFPLKEIKAIFDSPVFDPGKALEQQIALLELKKEHLENLINFAKGIKLMGVKALDFTAFDTKKIDEYSAQAKAQWGNTPAYREFEERAKNRTKEEERVILEGMTEIFVEFGTLKDQPPESEKAQAQVKKLQDYITENMYQCTDQILFGLGKMYAGGGDFTKNIDQIGGEGTAEFAAAAIEVYCRNK